MKRFSISIFLLSFSIFLHPPGLLAETKPGAEEEFFSIKGRITETSAEEKTFKIKREEGLELTYRADEATHVLVDGEEKALTSLAAGDPVEVEYFYNQNYEKIIQSITKTLPEKGESDSLAQGKGKNRGVMP